MMRRLLLGTGLLALAAVGAACSSAADEVKEKAVEQLAVGSWRCRPDAPGARETPFRIRIRPGGFTVTLEDASAANRRLTGTWAVEDGDLAIEFTGAAAGGPGLGIADFDRLSVDSTGFALTEPGVFAPDLIEEDMTVEEMSDLAKNPPPLEVDIELDGTRSITFDTAHGDPWRCDRT
jgi:hypothetical protein